MSAITQRRCKRCGGNLYLERPDRAPVLEWTCLLCARVDEVKQFELSSVASLLGMNENDLRWEKPVKDIEYVSKHVSLP